MLTIDDTIAGERIRFYYVENELDCERALNFAKRHRGTELAFDTEATGIDCYVPGWKLRTFQMGNARESVVIPAKRRKLIAAIMALDIKWIGHNGPHDVRSVDKHLGFETGVHVAHETYIYAHHNDPRNRKDGGTGNGLKELSVAHIDPDADKWERALKAAFKAIQVPIEGEVYKSGPRKGQQKMRRINLSEGWGLIPRKHPAYIAYAAGDPILTYRLWEHTENWPHDPELYARDIAIQDACDVLHRRALPVDTEYNRRYSAALDRAIKRGLQKLDDRYGITSVYGTAAIAVRLISLGAELTERTKKGAYKVDSKVLKGLAQDDDPKVRELATLVLRTKQRIKRKDVYADGIYNSLDASGRVHPSINSLAARTGRMSAGIFQQLPTKDETR